MKACAVEIRPAFRAVFSEDQAPVSPQSISPLACPPASPSPHGSSRELTCCFDSSWEERVGDGEAEDWEMPRH